MYRLPAVAMPFAEGSVHNILRDRAYIGEVEFRGNWNPGKQEPIVDRRDLETVCRRLSAAACITATK